jgi:hypothetical protein
MGSPAHDSRPLQEHQEAAPACPPALAGSGAHSLWPYVLCNAVLLHNALLTLEDGTSWLELFSSIQVGAKMAHNHTFACPVFVLQNELGAGNSIP